MKEEEVQWTDASIRWPEHDDEFKKNSNNNKNNNGGDDDDDDECSPFFMDPFKDANPFQDFSFKFEITEKFNEKYQHHHNQEQKYIKINIRGYKSDSDEVFESTGLTVWKAAEYLGQYQIKHSLLFHGKRILELGAGLGLNGILASCTSQNSKICITDGDTDALIHLRKNVERNITDTYNNDNKLNTINSKISCYQLIWGKSNAKIFLQQQQQENDDDDENDSKFDILLASDIVYAKCIIKPLWETVQILLKRKKENNTPMFIMSYANRGKDIPVQIDELLQSSVNAGFRYEIVKHDEENDIFIYIFRWKE